MVQILPKNVSLNSNSENPDINPKRLNYILTTIVDTGLDTTVHGVVPLIKREHPFIRLMWFVFLLASAVVCVYLIVLSILTYFEYETVTKTDQVYLLSTEFPAVTVCNINPFMTNSSVEFIDQLFYKNHIWNSTNPNDYFANISANAFGVYKYFASTNALDPKRTDAFRKSLGHQMDEMLFSCSYNFQSCSPSDFYWFYDIQYGNCFTFNSGIS